jgi:hypothetical protein
MGFKGKKGENGSIKDDIYDKRENLIKANENGKTKDAYTFDIPSIVFNVVIGSILPTLYLIGASKNLKAYRNNLNT